jgi:rubrerythrin
MANTKTLTHMVDAAVAVEKLRVASEVRQSHLTRQGKQDAETDELHRRLSDLEDYVDGRVTELIRSHPAYPWFSRVKGVGGENIGKVIAPIDIERAKTISALWKFAGFAVEDGSAPRRVKGGGKLAYNSQLRSMCWRLANSLKRAKGCFYEYYIREKEKYQERFLSQGLKILATPSGRWVCANCGASWARQRDISSCCDSPQIEKKLRQEPPGVIWLGHLDAMAVRKAIKLFLACLWLVWREAEGLPVTKPYAIEKQGHSTLIQPREMTDR